MLFYNGKSHKLDEVTFNIPVKNGKDDYMSPWTFTSNDGRFEMKFTPILDRQAPLNVGVICMLPHQVFGKFNGKAILDDGTVIEVKDMVGFAEKVHNNFGDPAGHLVKAMMRCFCHRQKRCVMRRDVCLWHVADSP